MKTNKILAPLLCLLLFAWPSFADDDKPLFQSENLVTILEWTHFNLDDEPTDIIETEYYIHKINFEVCTLISAKEEPHIFIGVENFAYYAEWDGKYWSLYLVPFEDQYNIITKRYHAMVIDFYKTGEECKRNREHRQEDLRAH